MQLPLPEVIERYILNYIGTPSFKFYKEIKHTNYKLKWTK